MLRRTVKDLGFEEALQQIRHYCLSQDGARRIASEEIITSREIYLEKQERISTILSLLSEQTNPDLETFPDIAPVLQQLQQTPYQNLEGVEIYDVGLFLQSARKLQAFLSSFSQNPQVVRFPVSDLIGEIPDSLRFLEDEIFYTLESPGEVKKTHPSIANALAEIDRRRADRASFSASLVQKNRSLMQADKPSYKDSRVVIPLKADLKSSMPGLVHSYSASNQTLYVEPFKLVEYNNSVVMAEQNLQLEIARLIAKLSAMIAKDEMALRELSRRVSIADSLYSYAQWARNRNCCRVLLPEDSAGRESNQENLENGTPGHFSIKLLGCRHPLLKGKAIPITLELPSSTRALVLSGPNAGGKTVTIKTVGLMALLNQICGFIPASDGSSLPLFDQIFTDIGDDQSIEAELSTFSGHMHQISFILRSMTVNSLVILDELGSGTDEVEGSAIAKAVLQFCMEKCRTTLISSHHNALKQFAYVSDSIANASMEFDEATHKPTFRVIAGLPGESHALDTAIRMRLPAPVIQMAGEFLGRDEMNVSKLIKGLEQRRLEADRRIVELEQKQKELTEKIRETDLRSLKLDQKEYFIKTGKLTEMDNFIATTRRQLENLVKELREGELTKEKTRNVKQFISDLEDSEKGFGERLRQMEENIENRDKANRRQNQEAPAFGIGVPVLCGQYKREGTIVRSDGKGKWQVAIGPMKFTFKESDLIPARAPEKKKVHVEYSIPTLKPKLTLDVRGKTLQEATDALANQIEACMVHGLMSFAVVHGYGDGILSHGLHQYLSRCRGIASYNYAVPEDGGQGKTYVNLG